MTNKDLNTLKLLILGRKEENIQLNYIYILFENEGG